MTKLGKGAPKDEAKAIKLYQAAAAAGDEVAYANLAASLVADKVVRRDGGRFVVAD